MASQRIPLAHNIGTRDGTLKQDAKLGNAIIEVTKGENVALVKRPGLTTYQTLTAGQANGIYSVGTHFFTIIGSNFYDNGVLKGTVDGTDEYDFITTVDQSAIFFKNEVKGYVYTISTGTILDLSGTITTQSGTMTSGSPTITLSASNSAIQPGQIVTSTSGYIPSGSYVLTVSGTTLTLSSNVTGSTTETLTFTTSYPGATVSGAAFIDGYFVVGTPAGLIYNSNVEDPTTWQAINYIGAVSDSDPLVAITRTINYILAMGSRTIEFFYDAGNSPGSPFQPYQNNVLQFGLAGEDSVVQMDNTIIWMSTSKSKGRQVIALSGVTPQIISNAFIERILNKCNPDLAYAFSIKISGHSLYILTLKDLGFSLVYDFAQQGWTYWTSTINNKEIYFNNYFYNNFNGVDLLQNESNGKVYIMDSGTYQDDGNPITVLARTPIVDFGNNTRKFFAEIQVIGDKVSSYAKVRYTNDDYNTFSDWQEVNLNSSKSQVNRNGQARRRAFDLLHVENEPLRLEYLEVDVELGQN